MVRNILNYLSRSVTPYNKRVSACVHKGTGRTVIVTNRVAIKLPRVKLGLLLRQLKDMVRHPGSNKIISYFTNPYDYVWSFKYPLLRGFIENWTEWRWSARLGEVVAPTYFSFLGLFNIQAVAIPFFGSTEVITSSLALIDAKENGRWLLSPGGPHTLGEPENYGYHAGRLKLLDYGSASFVHELFSHKEDLRRVFLEYLK